MAQHPQTRFALQHFVERIEHWQRAYPLDVFPEPDLKLAHEALKAKGLTLDAVSASAYRHVLKQMHEMATAALQAQTNPIAGADIDEPHHGATQRATRHVNRHA